jgi:lipoprotein-anchoring transpeptidase ErfK/SrfK
MRFWPSLAAVVALLFLVSGAEAGKIKFSSDTFMIYGGLGVGNASLPRSKRAAAIAVQTVAFPSTLAPGSIVVRTGERRLYLVLADNKALQYPVGVGREGFEWSGTNKITRKAEWPEWRPPPVMIAREAAKGRDIPDYMPGGPDNPLGARALYIGDTEYRIHGTSQPWTIGQASSSGCIRMLNEQVIDLYQRVKIGAQVVVE